LGPGKDSRAPKLQMLNCDLTNSSIVSDAIYYVNSSMLNDYFDLLTKWQKYIYFIENTS